MPAFDNSPVMPRDTFLASLDPAHPVIVRINAVGTDWFERDLAACRRPGIAAVMPESSDEALNVCRAQVVLASRVANIAPPIDSPTP